MARYCVGRKSIGQHSVLRPSRQVLEMLVLASFLHAIFFELNFESTQERRRRFVILRALWGAL